MKLGSLFSGSGGWDLAARMCGIEPVWASEIEPFPIKVTKKNFPNMKHLGDITKIHGDQIEPVDIITSGSPCFAVGTLISTVDGQKPIEEEIKWWIDVFETHRHIMGISSKPKTEKQIIKWLKNPHSDSAEYKMWGNGMALPCALYVMEGIKEYADKREK